MLIEENNKEKIMVSLRIEKNVYNQLCKIASKENIAISKLIRNYIKDGVNIKVASEDADRLVDIIQEQLEMILDRYMNRLIAMLSKNTKSSEAGKQATYNLLREFSNKNAEEIIEKCELLAIEYNSNKVHK